MKPRDEQERLDVFSTMLFFVYFAPGRCRLRPQIVSSLQVYAVFLFFIFCFWTLSLLHAKVVRMPLIFVTKFILLFPFYGTEFKAYIHAPYWATSACKCFFCACSALA